LTDLRDKLRASGDAYWSEIVDIQRQIAAAWMMFTQGKQEEALAAMRVAADAEDKTEKHPVTPGPLAPARELYGAMLLERGLASEALAQYEAGMSKEPNRLNAFLGAAKAAERLGDKAKARSYYDKVASITKDTETTRPEVLAARQARAAK
jgi:tetratricopeptide (TPR) repeat protein